MSYISLGDFDTTFSTVDGTSPCSADMNDMSRPTDNVEYVSKRTVQYKEIVENFCKESPNHYLEWKVENVIVDIKPPAVVKGCPRNLDSAHSRNPQHTGRLHTLRYTSANWQRKVNRNENLQRITMANSSNDLL